MGEPIRDFGQEWVGHARSGAVGNHITGARACRSLKQPRNDAFTLNFYADPLWCLSRVSSLWVFHGVFGFDRVLQSKAFYAVTELAAGAGAVTGAERNSTQKRLPFPGSESTPTLPPIRSTALRTIANPMPVPS